MKWNKVEDGRPTKLGIYVLAWHDSKAIATGYWNGRVWHNSAELDSVEITDVAITHWAQIELPGEEEGLSGYKRLRQLEAERDALLAGDDLDNPICDAMRGASSDVKTATQKNAACNEAIDDNDTITIPTQEDYGALEKRVAELEAILRQQKATTTPKKSKSHSLQERIYKAGYNEGYSRAVSKLSYEMEDGQERQGMSPSGAPSVGVALTDSVQVGPEEHEAWVVLNSRWWIA